MHQVSSPATVRFVSRAIDEASPRTFSKSVEPPLTDAACESLLSGAMRALRSAEDRGTIAADLARFLGASSSVWTSARRAQLRTILNGLGTDGVVAALGAVAATPRPEVSDEVERLLALSDSSIANLLAGIVEGSPIGIPNAARLTASAAVRASAVRVLADVPSKYSQPTLISALRRDAAAEVRDAAALGLARMGDARAVPELEHQLSVERDGIVRESIGSALEELRASR